MASAIVRSPETTHEQARIELGVRRGRALRPTGLIPIVQRARAAVIEARDAVVRSGGWRDDRIKLLWEIVSGNLYLLEESVAKRILPALELRGHFGVLGKGAVSPISIEAQASGSFLGRKLDMRLVNALDVEFSVEHEEAAGIVTVQAHRLTAALRGVRVPDHSTTLLLLAIAAVLWRRP